MMRGNARELAVHLIYAREFTGEEPEKVVAARLEKEYDGIPLTLILDGQGQRRTLALCGKDESWLKAQLEAQGIKRTKDVLIALLSTQGTLLLQ